MKNKRAKSAIDNFAEKIGSKILCSKSIMGSGKTFAVEHIINNHIKIYGEKSRILVISTRRGYARDIANNTLSKFNFDNYMDNGSNLNDKDRLIISLESLHKIYNLDCIAYYDLIILDEVESITSQFFSDTINNNRECFDELCKILKYAKKIVVLDADLDNRGMEFIKSISNDIKTLCNIFREKPKKFTIVNNYKKYVKSITTDVKNGKNICIVSLSRSVGLDIRDKLKKMFPDIADEIVCLHSESDASLKKEMNNIRENWQKYRVLIYTSIVGAGINFNIPDHFDRVTGYVCGGSESPRVFLQMIGRIRHPYSNWQNLNKACLCIY